MMAVTARLMTVDKAAFLAFTTLCTRPVTSTNGADELLTDLEILLDELPPLDLGGSSTVLPFPACETDGIRLAPVCFLDEGRLQTVNLWVCGGKRAQTAAQQRAQLFRLLRAQDPCPDTQKPVQLKCPFGFILIATEPRTGRAFLRVLYQAA